MALIEMHGNTQDNILEEEWVDCHTYGHFGQDHNESPFWSYICTCDNHRFHCHSEEAKPIPELKEYLNRSGGEKLPWDNFFAFVRGYVSQDPETRSYKHFLVIDQARRIWMQMNGAPVGEGNERGGQLIGVDLAEVDSSSNLGVETNQALPLPSSQCKTPAFPHMACVNCNRTTTA